MVFIGYLLVSSLGVSNLVNAAPLAIGRRSTTDATQAWIQKCMASGEGERCIEVGSKASKALLANAGVCDQQNVADEMIDLAKSLHHNSAELVTLAQEYAHASHATSGSCTTTPKNSELTTATTSAKTSAKKGKAVVGAAAKHKAQHKSVIRAKEDGEDEEETPEGEEGEGNGNQLPGSTPVTPPASNSTNTTAPTTQPSTTTPINIVVNSATPPSNDPNNNGTQTPPHVANFNQHANYTSQVLSINQALASATQSLSSAGNSLASALGVIAQAINNINSATQSLLPSLNITTNATVVPPLVANLAQNNGTNSTVPCPDPNAPGAKNGTTEATTPPADTGSTPPAEGQTDPSQGQGN